MIPASLLVAVAAAETLRRALGSLRTSERPLRRAERTHSREMRTNAQKMGFLGRTMMTMMLSFEIGIGTAASMGKMGLER